MAVSDLNTQLSYHTRSNSLPSILHPLTSEFDELLRRSKASEATSISSSSSICHKLNSLQDLHVCVDKLVQLPLNQTSAAHKKWFDELLDGSIRLLDACSTAKDALSQIKESAQELQSILRRRRGSKTGLACEVKKYLISRKAVKKSIHNALENLKCMKNKHGVGSDAVVNMLRQVESVNLNVLSSLLAFISGPKTASKLSGWSLVSKLIHNRRVACEEEEEEETYTNEISKVDGALHNLLSCKTSKPENVQNELQNLELCIEDLEGGIESLYRGLIKSRVSILNH